MSTPEVYEELFSDQTIYPGSKETVRLGPHKISALLLISANSYSLPNSTTITVVTTAIIGTLIVQANSKCPNLVT
jgi:hypothetical protein